MVALVRAVLVWAVVLTTIVLPRVQPAAAAATPPQPVITQLGDYHSESIINSAHAARMRSAEIAQAEAWASEFERVWNRYQARIQAEAEASAEAARIAALSNHPPPPAYIAKIISDAFSPLGPAAVQWAFNVAYCESRYHPNSVNSSSGASGLFQFLPSTWAGSPWHAQSPFDPVANAQAAAWLFKTYGPQRWVCQG